MENLPRLPIGSELCWQSKSHQRRCIQFGEITSIGPDTHPRSTYDHVYRIKAFWIIREEREGWVYHCFRESHSRKLSPTTVHRFKETVPAELVMEVTGIMLSDFLKNPDKPMGGKALPKLNIQKSPDRPLTAEWKSLRTSGLKPRLAIMATRHKQSLFDMAMALEDEGVTIPEYLIEKLI